MSESPLDGGTNGYLRWETPPHPMEMEMSDQVTSRDCGNVAEGKNREE